MDDALEAGKEDALDVALEVGKVYAKCANHDNHSADGEIWLVGVEGGIFS